jgi:hypothetical protein
MFGLVLISSLCYCTLECLREAHRLILTGQEGSIRGEKCTLHFFSSSVLVDFPSRVKITSSLVVGAYHRRTMRRRTGKSD